MPFALTKEKFLGRKAMSQNGRREFLTSAAAVAAALAACTAPARRAQAQQTCATIYDEHDIVPKVASSVHLDSFQDGVITFPATTTPTMAALDPGFVDRTLATLKPVHLTSVTVKNTPNPNLPPGLSPGTYDLVPLSQSGPPGKRSPVVLSLSQYNAYYGGDFKPDWNKILVFVIPNRVHGGHPATPDEANSDICIHPFGM
jgi:hypothetical protein